MFRAVLCAALLLAGCWVSPDPGLYQNRKEAGADLPDGQPTEGGTPDAAVDGPLTDVSPPDQGPPPKLSCTAPSEVGTSAPGALAECALRTNGLDLVAKSSGTWYVTKRSATDQPFGDWTTAGVLGGKQDPTFFSLKGIELAIVSHSPGSGLPRVLELCISLSSCSEMTLEDQNGQTITDDLDGPAVAVLSSGDLLMAHNVGPTGSSSAEIYLAQPSDSNDLSKPWVTAREPNLYQADYKADDPALSPDGLVLIYGGANSSGDFDLWVSQRTSVTESFPAAEQLTDVNTSSGDSSPYLAPMTPANGKTRYELFFSSSRTGSNRIYRSECSL